MLEASDFVFLVYRNEKSKERNLQNKVINNFHIIKDNYNNQRNSSR